MSRHGLHVEDFQNCKDKRNAKDFILHRARCGRLKPSRTCLDILFDKLETEQALCGWRHCYFPIDRRSDWKSASDDWTDIDEKYGNAPFYELSKCLAPKNINSKTNEGSVSDVRKIGPKKGSSLVQNKREKETNNDSFASKQRLSIQSLYVAGSDVSMAETLKKVARDQRYFNNRLQELSKRNSQTKEKTNPVSTCCLSSSKDSTTGTPNHEEHPNGQHKPNIAARKRRRTVSCVSGIKKNTATVSQSSGTTKQPRHKFVSPSKAFAGFTIYGEQNIQLQPTFPTSFKNDDPSEFRALAAQQLRLDMEFDQAKTACGGSEFPYGMIVHETRITEDSCTSSLAIHMEVKTFTAEKLEVEGTMSCTYSSNDEVNFNLKIFPDVRCTGRIKYRGTYRRQMKPGGQYMTWRFQL